MINKLDTMTADEKTHYVTNQLLNRNSLSAKNPTTYNEKEPIVEYYRTNDYEDNKTNNHNNVFPIITILLIILLLEKIYVIFKTS